MNPTRAVRLLITLAVPLVVWALGFVPLPGFPMPGALLAGRYTSLMGLGLVPFLSATLIVELAARIVPRWNRLRHDGRDGRARLALAALSLTLLLALVQATFVVRYLVSTSETYAQYGRIFDGGVGTQLLAMATLVAGSFLVIGLAALVDRFGLGSGMSVLLAGTLLPELAALGRRSATHGDVEARDLTTGAIEAFVLVAVSVWLLRRYRRGAPDADGTPPVRDPASGLLPPLYLGQLALLGVHWAAGQGWEPLVANPLREGTPVAIPTLLAVLACTWLFQDRRAHRRALVLASARAGLFLLALIVLDRRFGMNLATSGLNPLSLVILTAVALDLVGEWRARRVEPTLVPVYVAPSVVAADRVLDALAAADVPVFARAIHHRTLLQFFGPYVAITLLVPAARRDDALAHLPR